MTSKHTKGPALEPIADELVIDASQFSKITITNHIHDDDLLDAAPDLLKALETTLDETFSLMENAGLSKEEINSSWFVLDACAAIAKAEGTK